jgi:hypothetical protein
MSQCRFIDKCAFYNDSMRNMEETGHFIKQLFCQAYPERCNRLRDAMVRDVGDVNNDMTPWGMERKQVSGNASR